MNADLIKKARANRKAALAFVAARRSKLVSLSDFRPSAPSTFPLMGFVSTRAADTAGQVAA